MDFKNINKYWRSICFSIVIIVLCFTPGNKLPGPEFDFICLDKLVHFIFYFVLCFTIQYEIKKVLTFRDYLIIFIYAMILGGFIELVQENLIIDRSGDFFDFFADLSGALVAFPAFKVSRFSFKK